MMRVISALLLGSVVAAGPVQRDALAGSAADPGFEDKEASYLLQRSAEHANLKAARVKEIGQAQDLPPAWAILGLTEYRVKREHQGEWWPDIGDIFADDWIGPMGYKHRSKVVPNRLDGDLDLHIYLLANSTEVNISLYDHDDFSEHDFIGSASFVPLGPTTGCDESKASVQGGCPFKWTMTKETQHGQVETATLKGYFAMGDAMYSQRRAANKRGVLVQFEECTREHHVFELARIQNDKIEEELFYAEAGSVFPQSLHGIHWMDQRGRTLADGPYPSDPEYRQVCARAAEENLVHFGEAAWDPKTLCATGVRQYSGGPLSGHWSWMDAGDGKSRPWAAGIAWHMKYDFCFRDKSMTYIDVLTRISINKFLETRFGLGEDYLPFDFEFTLPTWINNVGMAKRPWGWDRVTTLGPSWLRRLTAMLYSQDVEFIQNFFNALGLVPEIDFEGTIACHYPVLQVVDGHGKRTDNYAAYLEYLNNQTTCSKASFECPVNRGQGTQLIGRLSAASFQPHVDQ